MTGNNHAPGAYVIIPAIITLVILLQTRETAFAPSRHALDARACISHRSAAADGSCVDRLIATQSRHRLGSGTIVRNLLLVATHFRIRARMSSGNGNVRPGNAAQPAL